MQDFSGVSWKILGFDGRGRHQIRNKMLVISLFALSVGPLPHAPNGTLLHGAKTSAKRARGARAVARPALHIVNCIAYQFFSIVAVLKERPVPENAQVTNGFITSGKSASLSIAGPSSFD